MASGRFILQFRFVALVGDSFKHTILQTIALTKKHLAILIAEDIAAIGNGKEGMAHTIGVGDVLKQPQAIQIVVLHLLIVGQNVHIRLGKSRQEPLKLRCGFSRLFRLGIDHIGAVHRAGADAHHHAGVILQQLPQTDPLKECILRRHMATSQHDQIAVGYQLRRLMGVSAVQHLIGTEMDTAVGKGHKEICAETAVQIRAIRAGTDIQAATIGRQSPLQPLDQAVLGIHDRPVGAIHKGAAGNKQFHRVTLSVQDAKASVHYIL